MTAPDHDRTPLPATPPTRPTGSAITRRSLILGTIVAGVVAACGGSDDASGDTAAVPTSEAAADTSAAPVTVDSTAAATTQPAVVATEPAPETTEPPVGPRIAALDPRTLDILVALGANVVAAQPAGTGIGIPDYLAEIAPNEIEVIGDGGAINLEALAAVAPDLMIGSSGTFDDVRDALNGIAPVEEYDSALFTDQGAIDYAADIRTVSGIIGMEEAGETLVADLQARIDETAAATEGKEGAGIAIMRVFGADGYRMYGLGSVPVVITEGADITLAPLVADLEPGRFVLDISQELVVDVPADHIFVSIGNFSELGTPEQFELLAADPLWSSVPAVQAGNATPISDVSAWFIGGPIGWQVMLDEIDAHFATR